MKNILKYIGMVLSAILPILGMLAFAGIYDVYLYNWLWCGFYGCILVCILARAKIYKASIIILNLAIILICAFGALMGGFYGLWIILLHLLVPFYSALF